MCLKGLVEPEQQRLISRDFGIELDCRSSTTDIEKPGRNPIQATIHLPGNPGSALRRNVTVVRAARWIASTGRW